MIFGTELFIKPKKYLVIPCVGSTRRFSASFQGMFSVFPWSWKVSSVLGGEGGQWFEILQYRKELTIDRSAEAPGFSIISLSTDTLIVPILLFLLHLSDGISLLTSLEPEISCLQFFWCKHGKSLLKFKSWLTEKIYYCGKVSTSTRFWPARTIFHFHYCWGWGRTNLWAGSGLRSTPWVKQTLSDITSSGEKRQKYNVSVLWLPLIFLQKPVVYSQSLKSQGWLHHADERSLIEKHKG